jgi:hypothetical protein
MKKIFYKYRLELIVLILGLSVAILIVGNFEIQGIFQRIFYGALALVQNVSVRTVDKLIAFGSSFSVTEFLGVAFIIGAIGFVFFRIRHHFRSDPDYDATDCPRCGSSLKRVHRTSFDRFLGKTILPNSRRYRCANKSCGWSGLRHHRYHPESSIPDREASQSR